MFKDLSATDKKVYAFIRSRLLHSDTNPTLKEINKITGGQSPRSAVLVLDRLEKAGMIKRASGKIQLTSPDISDTSSMLTIEIPLVGHVAAGVPILAEENVETMIPVSIALARPGSQYFLLRVVGDSMNMARIGGVPINNNDIVLVRQQETADDGNVVVALINDEATIKFLERRSGFVILRPRSSNSAHKPILLTDNLRIQGVVVAVLPSDLY